MYNPVKNFYRQFGNPKGLTGEFVGYLLALKNQRRTDWVISLMNIESGDKILEIGYGPGIAVEKITKILTTGSITGIDISSVMQKQAFKRNLSEIKKGKARLSKGSIDSLGLNEKFDKIFGINVHLFWKDPVGEIVKLKQHLNNDGQIILALQPRYVKSDTLVMKEAEKTKNYFQEAGMEVIKFKFKTAKPISIFYVAAKCNVKGNSL
jgi:trans-aconitate methyltransferase